MTKEEALKIAKEGIDFKPLQDRLVVLAITEDKIDHYEKLGITIGEEARKEMKAEKSMTLGQAIVVAVGPGKESSLTAGGNKTKENFAPGDLVYCFTTQIEADLTIGEVTYLVFKEDRIILKENKTKKSNLITGSITSPTEEVSRTSSLL